ncbi:O-antigen ligase family protein [Sphaerimonospora sp. CA-214678]|uniref:O-antigen ligase family protein n=1 Tax=Sphaerimonospora sp. CA-214678 TaxID=3240029 RepID=UPI003D8D1E76
MSGPRPAASPTRRRPPIVDMSGRHGFDGATLGVAFAVVVLLVPARLVLRGLPFALTPAEGIGLFAGMWWLCAHLTDTLGAAKGHNGVRTAIFVYAVSQLATYAYSSASYLPARELSLSDHSAVISAAMLGTALLACDGVRGRDRLDLVLKTIVVAGAVVGLIGAVQYLLTFDPTLYMDIPGTQSRVLAEGIYERAGVNRAAATASHPIEFGVLCAMILPLALHYAFEATESGGRMPRWWLCCALVASGMVFSASRSPMLGLAVSGLVLFFGWSAARRVRALLALAGFVLAVKVTAPGLLGAITALFTHLDNDTSLMYRTNDYATALAEISRHPLLGRGIGTWYAPEFIVFDNQYLLTTVEAGIIGLLALVLMFSTGIWASLRARWRVADRSSRDLGLSLAACLVVPLVGAATFDLQAFQMANAMSFLLVGLSGALSRTVKREITLQGEPESRPQGPTAPAARIRPRDRAG